MRVLIKLVDETCLHTEEESLDDTKESIEDDTFKEFHTCYIVLKAGSVPMFIILMIMNTLFETEINILRPHRKKEEESPLSHQSMYQMLTAKYACFLSLSDLSHLLAY
jgi:hypothetical protein